MPRWKQKKIVGEGTFIFCDKLVDFSLRTECPCMENEVPDVGQNGGL